MDDPNSYQSQALRWVQDYSVIFQNIDETRTNTVEELEEQIYLLLLLLFLLNGIRYICPSKMSGAKKNTGQTAYYSSEDRGGEFA